MDYIKLTAVINDLFLLPDQEHFFSIQYKKGETYAAIIKDGKYVSVTKKQILKHLEGDLTISIQPIAYPSNKCKYGAIDFDTSEYGKEGLEKLLLEVQKLCALSKSLNLIPYVEYSGKKGFHVYYFCDEAIEASVMRRFLRFLCDKLNKKNQEIFPDADFISHEYYPRPLKLVYAVHQATNRRSGFIDINNVTWDGDFIEILPNQDEYMTKIKKNSHSTLRQLAGEIKTFTYVNKELNWSAIGDNHPPCIGHLLTLGAINSLEYNKSNLTLARYVADRGRTDERFNDDLLLRLGYEMAKNSSSHPTTKTSVEEKVNNLRSIIKSRNWRKKKWICSYIWANREHNKACYNCPFNLKFNPSTNEIKLFKAEFTAQIQASEKEIKEYTPKKVHEPSPCIKYLEDKKLKASTDIEMLISDISSTKTLTIEVFNDSLIIFCKSLYHVTADKLLELKDLLQDYNITKIAYNTIQLHKFLFTNGININGYFDIKLAHQITTMGIDSNFDPLYILSKYGDERFPYSSLKNSTLEEQFLVFSYFVSMGEKIRAKLLNEIKEQKLLESYMNELAHVKVSADLELYGMKLDKEKFLSHRKYLEEKLNTIIKALKQYNFNMSLLNDNPAFLNWLKNKGYTYPNTQKNNLLIFKDQIPEIPLIIEYRSIAYELGKFSNNILSYLDKNDRIKTHVEQIGSDTARLTTYDYSTVNVPKGFFRSCIIPAEGNVLIRADFCRQEVIILLEITQEPSLLEAELQGIDIHRFVASMILNKPIEQVTKEERNAGKGFVYKYPYGMGDKRIRDEMESQLGVSKTLEEVATFRKIFFDKFPKIKDRMDIVSKNYKGLTKIRALSGRIRNFNPGEISYMQALNTPIQMTASDIIKRAAGEIWYNIHTYNYRAFFVNEIFDELLVECHKDDANDVYEIIQNEMMKAARRYLKNTYMDVDIKICSNWEEAK